LFSAFKFFLFGYRAIAVRLFKLFWLASRHLLNEVSIGVNEVRELHEVLEDGVLVHVFLQLSGIELLRIRKDGAVDLLEAAERIDWSTFAFRSLKEIFSPWVKSLIWVLSWSASSSAACWWVSELSIGTFGVLLLHVSVKRGVRKIGLVTIFALEISSRVVVLAPSFASDALAIAVKLVAVV
jgi:hypothetical protein